ncbi:MAG: hypothetical protein COV46_02195 [Deltaproteobacteria bacterium CG11_big_fil_rev_8_21_14_0_20_49_13]|nr:MAG: hypothetical protein COV46_02195 [Deltaproteobacteria bacterium CG11_big_fil_rev_8_21_14_0_20_49_13]
MHELTIIRKVVVAADRAAEANNIAHVKVLRLRMGQMAAVYPDQISFGFLTYAKGTRLEKAKLEIEKVKVLLECYQCLTLFGDERFEDHGFAHAIAHAPLTYLPPKCPKCSSERIGIKNGREMELVDLAGE